MPTCPHCGTEFDDELLWYSDEFGKVYTEDEDESDLICPNDDCKKPFRVMACRTLSFIGIEEEE